VTDKGYELVDELRVVKHFELFGQNGRQVLRATCAPQRQVGARPPARCDRSKMGTHGPLNSTPHPDSPRRKNLPDEKTNDSGAAGRPSRLGQRLRPIGHEVEYKRGDDDVATSVLHGQRLRVTAAEAIVDAKDAPEYGGLSHVSDEGLVDLAPNASSRRALIGLFAKASVGV
jgi:hypothetical protein